MKKKIVLSGINIRAAGTLSVFYNCLDEIIQTKSYKTNDFVIMVSNKELFKSYNEFVTIIEFPKEQQSRILRFYYEYLWLVQYSKKNDIFLWISLNDKTPRVKTERQYVYCHNSSIFYHCTIKDVWFSPLFFVYTLFYGALYKYNIKFNDAVIVQQNWIAKEFRQRFPVKKVLVMRPEYNVRKIEEKQLKIDRSVVSFIYPTAPRSFKNCEVILEASKLLSKQNIDNYIVYLTIRGNENKYARYLFNKYGKDKHIKFIGFLNRDELEDLYSKSNCLLFPSKLETWGLPLSEFSRYKRNIIATDMLYAHETLRNYTKVAFFQPNDCNELSELMRDAITGKEFKSNLYNNRNAKNTQILSWTELMTREEV